MLAVLSVITYRQRKDRDLLWLALAAVVLVPVALLGNSYLPVTVPVVFAAVAGLLLILRRQRRRHPSH